MKNRRADFVDTRPRHEPSGSEIRPSHAPRKPVSGLLSLALQNLVTVGLGIAVVYALKYLLMG